MEMYAFVGRICRGRCLDFREAPQQSVETIIEHIMQGHICQPRSGDGQ